MRSRKCGADAEREESRMSINRRRLVPALGATGAGLMMGDRLSRAAPATPVASTDIDLGQTGMPDWTFALRAFDDPYTGKLVFPSEVKAGTRVIHAEVVITNHSEQPLDFQISNIRLLDSEGVEYGGGSAQGAEPKLVSQVLPGGERSRGSVWFIAPSDANLTQLKFYAPAPQLRIPLVVS
jgi:hypothetical protein